MELQNMVRSLDGIPAVLGACGPNHVNQIRNWAIQTINQVWNTLIFTRVSKSCVFSFVGIIWKIKKQLRNWKKFAIFQIAMCLWIATKMESTISNESVKMVKRLRMSHKL